MIIKKGDRVITVGIHSDNINGFGRVVELVFDADKTTLNGAKIVYAGEQFVQVSLYFPLHKIYVQSNN